MIRKMIYLTVLCNIFITVLFAQVQVNPQGPIPQDSTVRVGKLDNGLTYYIMHNDKPAQRAEFYIITNVGAAQETPDQDGLAHFLEHMCFNGTKNFPDKNIISYMESIGCKFGENVNAGTSFEQTTYFFTNVPVTRKGIIDTTLLILHDYAGFVENNPKEIDAERGVILEEKRTRDIASWRALLATIKALYKGSAMENVTLIGSEDNLKNFKPESLLNYYHTWYRPDNQAVIVVGDVNVDEVENTIKSTFSAIAKREDVLVKAPIVVPTNAEPIVSIFTDKEQSSTDISYTIKSQPMPKEYRGMQVAFLQSLMQQALTRMLNERLSDIAKSPNAPFLSASAGFGKAGQYLDMFSIDATNKDGEGIKGLDAIVVELERAKRYGFTEDEYQRAKTNIIRGYEVAKENASSRKNAQLVNPLINNFIGGYDYASPASKYEMAKAYLEMIPIAALNQAMAQSITDENVVILYQAPEKEGITTPSESDILNAIATAKASDIKAPVAESINEPLLDQTQLKGSKIAKIEDGKFDTKIFTLSNGIEVIVKPTDYKKDEVILQTYRKGGKSILPLALMPSVDDNIFSIYLQNAGISTFPQAKLNKMLAGKAVKVSPYMQELNNGFSASASPKDLETMLQLLYLGYTAPRFEEQEFEVGMNQIKTVLPNMLKQPQFAYQMKLMNAIGKYSQRRPILSEELLEQVTLNNIKEAYNALFSDANGTQVFITGNVDIETLKPLMEKYIGSLPIKSNISPNYVDHKYSFPKGIVNNDFQFEMQTPKTSVGMLFTGDLDYSLENDILMTVTTNVLQQLYTKIIREDEGGTYGVGVMATVEDKPSNKAVLLITFDTDVAKADKLREIAINGLMDIAKNGPNPEYVSKSKENLIKAFPEKQINNGFWQSVVMEYFTKDRDSYSTYLDMVNNIVTTANVQKIAKELLDQNNRIDINMTPKQ